MERVRWKGHRPRRAQRRPARTRTAWGSQVRPPNTQPHKSTNEFSATFYFSLDAPHRRRAETAADPLGATLHPCPGEERGLSPRFSRP